MKLSYFVASLIVGFFTVSTTHYADVHDLLRLQENSPRVVKTIKNQGTEARLPRRRGMPTHRESGGVRTIRQAELNEIDQQFIAGK